MPLNPSAPGCSSSQLRAAVPRGTSLRPEPTEVNLQLAVPAVSSSGYTPTGPDNPGHAPQSWVCGIRASSSEFFLSPASPGIYSFCVL